MFHIYFCEGASRPEAIVSHRRGHLEVECGHVGMMTEEFLRLRPAEDRSFAEFKARWKADDALENIKRLGLDRGAQYEGFLPSGLLAMSGLSKEWKSFRRHLEADIWLFVDADRRPVTAEVRAELLRWLRGDHVVLRDGNRTIEAFAAFVKSFGGMELEAERELVDRFARRLSTLKSLSPLTRLRSFLTMTFDPVPPDRDLEWTLVETMQKELETHPDDLRELLDVSRARTPLWGYPAGSLLSPCLVELAYCIENNIPFRKCRFPECATWFALSESRTAKDCHRCRSLSGSTQRWRARLRAENPEEYKLRWAWRRSNERRAKLGQPSVSLEEYRKTYEPRGRLRKGNRH